MNKELQKEFESKVNYLIEKGMTTEEAEKCAKGLLLLGV